MLKILAKFVGMIPLSIGHILIEFLKLWIKNNKNLNPYISDFDRFIKWERGELVIDLTKFNSYYYNRFIANNPDGYCDSFSEKIKEQVSQFISEADFTTIQLKICFQNVGMRYSRTITAEPKSNNLKIVK